ncbi:hypothetical protein HYQ44_020444 [Verticillium longisporum]|nr:hypothetical protein HYQ44_020444 [Verticillium longisporum]
MLELSDAEVEHQKYFHRYASGPTKPVEFHNLQLDTVTEELPGEDSFTNADQFNAPVISRPQKHNSMYDLARDGAQLKLIQTPSRSSSQPLLTITTRMFAAEGIKQQDRPHEVKAGPDDSDFNDAYVDSKQEMKTVINGQELSINRRRPDAPNGRHSLPNVESRQSSKAPIAARKEINTQDPRETERLKQAETRRPQFALEREVANTNNANLGKPMQHGSQLPQMVNNSCGRASLGHSFYSHDDLQCLERVWQMQEE